MRLKPLLLLAVVFLGGVAMAKDTIVYNFKAKSTQQMHVGDHLMITLQIQPGWVWSEQAGGHPGLRLIATSAVPSLPSDKPSQIREQFKFVAVKQGVQTLVLLYMHPAKGSKPTAKKVLSMRVR